MGRKNDKHGIDKVMKELYLLKGVTVVLWLIRSVVYFTNYDLHQLKHA